MAAAEVAKQSFIAGLTTNIFFWIVATFVLLTLLLLLFIFIIIVFRKSHAGAELKGWLKGRPISMFFQENRYVDWKVLKPEAGIIIDKNYGGFIVNERATYIDKKTKNVIIPFDAQFGASINIHAAKLADDLQYIMKDEEEMASLRSHIANNTIDENETINVLKTSVSIGAIKTMMTALIPHNINSKIEKILAQRIKNYGKVDVAQLLFLFCAMLGAIIIGGLIVRSMLK